MNQTFIPCQRCPGPPEGRKNAIIVTSAAPLDYEAIPESHWMQVEEGTWPGLPIGEHNIWAIIEVLLQIPVNRETVDMQGYYSVQPARILRLPAFSRIPGVGPIRGTCRFCGRANHFESREVLDIAGVPSEIDGEPVLVSIQYSELLKSEQRKRRTFEDDLRRCRRTGFF
jgi:hypothetical protein